MKATLVVVLIALAYFCADAANNSTCDPDSNGKPNCTEVGPGVYRNFWDPVHYWQCPEDGSSVVSVICPIAELFDSQTKECVLWNQWKWVNPCPTEN